MPRELTFREIQLRELEILRTVASWLEEQGLTYSLTGGTLLGAIRHQGFIPWDDDVDICLPRPHYRRMCQLLRTQGCRIGDVEAHLPGEKDYRFSFVKFMDPRTISTGGSGKGRIPLRIDAFPMDRLPVDSIKYRRDMRTFHRLRLVLWSATRKREDVPEFRGNAPKSRLRWWLCRAAGVLAGGYRNVARLVDLHGRWVDWRNRKGARWGNITWTSYPSDYFDEAQANGTFETQWQEFEGERFRIICGYHQYLTVVYGDYMTPPPEAKRDQRHNRVVYDLTQ